jgi:PAS domain S-box-containing protein
MDINLRPSGIDGLGDMSWGNHFCLFYETKEDLLDFFIPFFKAGLEHQEFCLCVASEPLIAEEAEHAMRKAFPDFERYLTRGQIEITPHTDWYLKDGYFNEQRVLQGWIDKLDQAFTKGFSGVRFAANILLEKSEWESFARYEGKLEETLRNLHIEGLCAYNLNRYSGANVLDIMHQHQFTLARRDGKWEPLEGLQLKQAHKEVLKLNAELEQRVADRTASLTTINEQLRAEIAERTRMEEALRESEEKFSAAFRASPIGLVIATVDGKYVEVNQALCDLLGYSRAELLGRTAVEIGIFAAETREEWVKALERGGNVIIHRELSFQLPNGISRTTLSSVEMITLHGVPHRLSTVLDITERKEAEEAIRKSEQVLREAESLGHTGSWEQNLVTGEIFNTEENLRLFFGDDHRKGVDFENYAEVVHPDDREYVMRRRLQLLAEGGPRDIEYRVVWPDGSVHVIFGRATVVYDELGQAIRVYGTNVDITERKQAEEGLRKSEDHLRLVIDTIPIMTWSVRPDGIVDFLNQRWMDYTGLSLEQYVEDPSDPIHPEDNPRIQEKWLAATAAGEPYEAEMRLRGADGEYRWFLVRTDPLRDESGRIIKWYGVSTDIDDRKRAEEEKNRQAARAETLVRIAARLNKQLELDAVIHAVCEEVINTFKVSQVTISLYDKKRDLLVYAGGINILPEYATNIEPITRSRFDDFLREMGPIMVVPDIQSLPGVPNAEFSYHLDVRTVVTAAMLRDQELIGVLVVGVNDHVREFDKDELTLLKAISDQSAQAIANAQLLKAAKEQHEQLRALSSKLVEVQETERQALTTELHDRVGQNLTGLSINLQNMKAMLPEESAKILTAEFNDAQTLLEEITRQIRHIMAELHLPELEDYGLAVALETYAEQVASRANLKLITAFPDLGEPPLSSEFRIALFRAAQEAITNVLKHSSASRLIVSLEEREDKVRLMVEDNGRGFDQEADSQPDSQTWGLKIMRERIESIGGSVQIESKLGMGTQVIFEIKRSS